MPHDLKKRLNPLPAPAPSLQAAHFADEVSPALADVALVDARQCANAAGVSLSLWYELVRDGKAPPPAFRGNRCTRYRVAEVRAWLVEFARNGLASADQSKAGA